MMSHPYHWPLACDRRSWRWTPVLISVWCNSPYRYTSAAAATVKRSWQPGAMRVSLDGSVTGVVTEAELARGRERKA